MPLHDCVISGAARAACSEAASHSARASCRRATAGKQEAPCLRLGPQQVGADLGVVVLHHQLQAKGGGGVGRSAPRGRGSTAPTTRAARRQSNGGSPVAHARSSANPNPWLGWCKHPLANAWQLLGGPQAMAVPGPEPTTNRRSSPTGGAGKHSNQPEPQPMRMEAAASNAPCALAPNIWTRGKATRGATSVSAADGGGGGGGVGRRLRGCGRGR